MTRSRKLFAAPLAFVILSSLPVFAQPSDPPYRVIGSKQWKQEELDRAAADGYRFLAGDAASRVAVLERSSDPARRTFLFVSNVGRFLKDKKLPPGFRLVAPSFGGNGMLFDAVFEKVEGDDRVRDYRLVDVGSAGALRKRFERGEEGSSGVVAVAALPGAAAIYEVGPDARRATIVASGNTGTLQRELKGAGERGLCITDSDGIKEAMYLMEDCQAGSTPRTYEVLAATKTETLEREINAAAARGMRFVPNSLVGIEKRVLGNPYNYETIAVVERAVDAAPITYRVLGVSRVPTLANELRAAADEGFRLIALAIGPKEVVAVLEKR